MRITACGGGGPLGRFHNMLFSLVRGTKPPARSDGLWTELTIVVPTEAEAASIFTGSSIAKTTPHAAATRAEGQPISSGATQDELSEPDSSSLSSSSGKLAIECAKVRADDADKRAALADKRAALADERAALADEAFANERATMLAAAVTAAQARAAAAEAHADAEQAHATADARATALAALLAA